MTGLAAPGKLDTLQSSSDPESWWSRANIAEAIPGVCTPLGWSLWGDSCERSMRRAFHAIGPLRRCETRIPDREEDRMISIFHGRPSLRVDFMFLMGDRMPGTDARAIAEQVFAAVPPGLEGRHSDPRFYPLVAGSLPLAFARAPRLVREARVRTGKRWNAEIPRIAACDDVAALQGSFLSSRSLFEENIFRAALCLFAVVQPIHDLLTKTMAGAGAQEVNLMAGLGGHEETEMIDDLWECSRDRLSVDSFLARHGFHGPATGQLSSVAWREDSTPVRQILDRYRGMSEDAHPARNQRERAAHRDLLEHQVLAALPRPQRGAARAVIAMSRRTLPLRAVGKVAFLQSVDLARAAARQLGVCLVSSGRFERPDDVFFLTVDELATPGVGGDRATIAHRRECYEEHRKRDLPGFWQGDPDPVMPHDTGYDDRLVLQGVAASPGKAEGRVRVVTDPGDCATEEGEVIVGRTTDPSWASILYMSSALVMDIGGPLSHAAVVARELGIPCVADTKVGTTALRTGDLCRVDGTTGRVEVLERAAPGER